MFLLLYSDSKIKAQKEPRAFSLLKLTLQILISPQGPSILQELTLLISLSSKERFKPLPLWHSFSLWSQKDKSQIINVIYTERMFTCSIKGGYFIIIYLALSILVQYFIFYFILFHSLDWLGKSLQWHFTMEVHSNNIYLFPISWLKTQI